MKLIAIVPAAGLGKRFDASVKKTMVTVKGLPLLIYTLMGLNRSKLVSEIIPVINEEDMEEWIGIIDGNKINKINKIVPGGKDRQDSVFNALSLLKEEGLVLIHDGVRPVIPVGLIDRLVNGQKGFDGIVPGLPVRETIKTVGPDGIIVSTANRDKFWTVQTPQVFPLTVIKKAYESAYNEGFYATDDAALVERLGGKVKIIEGSPFNIKVTTRDDLDIVEYLLDRCDMDHIEMNESVMRIGSGFDSHRLTGGRRLIIGGVEIPFDKGLSGHSDADVLCHAFIDAIIGAMGLGDIGVHFPDTDVRWKGASSIELLSITLEMMRKKGYKILWVDSTIIAERPKLKDFTARMKKKISAAGIPLDLINIKVKTNEGMGFIGRGEGIAAQAVCLLGAVK